MKDYEKAWNELKSRLSELHHQWHIGDGGPIANGVIPEMKQIEDDLGMYDELEWKILEERFCCYE